MRELERGNFRLHLFKRTAQPRITHRPQLVNERTRARRRWTSPFKYPFERRPSKHGRNLRPLDQRDLFQHPKSALQLADTQSQARGRVEHGGGAVGVQRQPSLEMCAVEMALFGPRPHRLRDIVSTHCLEPPPRPRPWLDLNFA